MVAVASEAWDHGLATVLATVRVEGVAVVSLSANSFSSWAKRCETRWTLSSLFFSRIPMLRTTKTIPITIRNNRNSKKVFPSSIS